MKKHHRSIFISDLHLGTKECNHQKLIDFLDKNNSDFLYLVGGYNRFSSFSGTTWME